MKRMVILVVVQGIYLQIEGLNYGSRELNTAAIALDHVIDIAIFLLAFLRPNAESERQRLLLVMVVVANIGYCVFMTTFYGIGCPCAWQFKK